MRGFSLVETLITVAVLSITALGSASLIANMTRDSSRTKQTIARANYEQRIVGLYRKNDLCSCNLGSLGGLAIPATGSVPLTSLKSSCSSATNDVYQNTAGGYQAENFLLVTGMTVSNPQVISGNSFSAELTINYDNSLGDLKPGKFIVLFEKTAAAGPPYRVSNCTIGGALTGAGSSAGGWELDGNSGTNPTTNFLGTTDDNDIVFKRNSLLAGALRATATSFGTEALLNSTGTNNTAVGGHALRANTTGSNNTATGTNALTANTTGSDNSAFGHSTLASNTTGNRNSAFGYSALLANTTGSDNTAVGFYALTTNTTGNENTAVGSAAMLANTTGNQNTAVGFSALYVNTTGSQNVAFGHSSLATNTTGSENTAIGGRSLLFNVTGSRNTAVGYLALQNSLADDNTAVGRMAASENTTGTANTAVGMAALLFNTTGSSNVAFGHYALSDNTTANGNTAIGMHALRFNTTGGPNVAVGTYALMSNTTGIQSTAFGARALYANTTGGYNTAFGYRALQANTTGSTNLAIGHMALSSSTTGGSSTAIGYGASSNTTGASSTAIGYMALPNTVTGSNHTAIGAYTANAITTEILALAYGHSALREATCSQCIGIGVEALRYVTGGASIGIGYRAGGTTAVNNQNNIYIGYMARPVAGAPFFHSNAIAIGKNAQVSTDNTMILGGTGADAVNVGIGVSAPTYQLQLSTDSAGKPGSATWTVASDSRLKEVRAPFVRGLDAVNQISPIYYRYKKDNSAGLPSEPEYVGVLAQEVQRAIPEAVKKHVNGFLTVNTDAIIWTMLNAIKELFAYWFDHSEELKHEISQLEIDNARLTRAVAELEENNSMLQQELQKNTQLLGNLKVSLEVTQ